MKKLIIAIMLFGAVAAFAAGEHQVATSQAYVAEELETRQDKFQKLGADTAMTYSGSIDGAIGSRAITGTLGAETNTSDTSLPTVGGVNTKLAGQQDELNLPADTVLVNTGVAGAPTTKAIYDDSGSYNTQTDTLIDAATFNAAMQNAINSELVCAVRKDPNDPTSPCYLFDIVTPTTNLIIPDTYTRLEYLESTGTQYIDSGVEAKPGTMVEAKFQILDEPPSANYDYGFLGAWSNGRQFYYLYLFNRYAGSNLYVYSIVGMDNLAFNTPITDHNVHTIKILENGDYFLDGVHKFTNLYDTSESSGVNIGIFRPIRPQFAPMSSFASRFYYVKLDNGTVLRNFIPAKRNSDGVLGMYDTVSGTFFTNAGTGTFIAGPELSSNIYLPME